MSWEEHRRNVDIRKEARVVGIADMMRRKQLAWYGHVCRREEDSDVRRTSEMTIAARRKRGRPKAQMAGHDPEGHEGVQTLQGGCTRPGEAEKRGYLRADIRHPRRTRRRKVRKVRKY